MLYEQYENKVKKAWKVRNFFYRFRVLFGTLIAVMVLLGVILFNIRGLVRNDIHIGVSYVYGQPLAYQSASLLGGDVSYEFATYPDGTWTDEEPKMVGQYQMRAVSKNNYGKPTYGEVQNFEIKPRETVITITTDQMVYGDTPSIECQLVSGDTLNEVKFLADDISLPSPEYRVDLKSVKVLSEDGKDMTSNYQFVTAPKPIDLISRELVIQMNSASKVYDGVELTDHGYQITKGSLAEGDYFKDDVTTSSSILDYTSGGVVNDGTNPTIYNAEGRNVTNHYSVRVESGNLSIQKRPLTIRSLDFTKVYDGNPVLDEQREISVEGDLVDGDKVYPIWKNQNSFSGGGESHSNDFDYSIQDKNGHPVTDNYEVTKVLGKITIEKKDITVDILAKQYYYSDSLSEMNHTLNEDEYTVNGMTDPMVNGEKVTVELVVQGNQSTSLTPQVSVKVTKECDDHVPLDTTENYNITLLSDNRYSFVRHRVEIQFSGTTGDGIVYDGKDHEFKNYQVTLDGTPIGNNVTDFTVPGYHLDLSGFKTYHMAQTAQENSASVRILDSEDRDCTSYFDLSLIPGTVTIQKRPLEITLPESITEFYDGKSYGFDETDFVTNHGLDSGLAEGDSFLVDASCVQKISKPNESFRLVQGTPDDPNTGVKFTYKVLSSDGNDMTSNYEITAKYPGEMTSCGVTIKKRKLWVGFSVDSFVKWYDGKKFDLASLEDKVVMENHPEIDGYGVYEGADLSVTLLPNVATLDFGKNYPSSQSLTDVFGTLDPSSYLHVFNGSVDVTDYFDITVTSFPTVYFKQVKLVFDVTSEDHVYDSVTFNEPSSSSGVSLNEESDYPSDGELSYEVKGSGRNVGTYSIDAVSASLTEADGTVIPKEMMDISFSGKHSFDIIRKSLSLSIPSFVYWKNSSSPLSLQDFQDQIQVSGLCGTDEVEAKLKNGASLPNQEGTYPISDFLDIRVFHSEGTKTDVTENYDITYSYGNCYYKKVRLRLHYNVSQRSEERMYNSQRQDIDYQTSNFYAEEYVENGSTDEEKLANMTRPEGGTVTVSVDPNSTYGLDVGSYRIRLSEVGLVMNGKQYLNSKGDLDYVYDEEESPSLTITKKTPFSVSFTALKKHVYDGRSVCFDSGVVNGTDANRYSYSDQLIPSDLVSDQMVVTLKEGVKEGPKECGTFNLNDYFEVRMMRTENSVLKDVTYNYDLTYDLGSITIGKLSVSVSLDDWTSYWHYDKQVVPSPTVSCSDLDEFDYSEDSFGTEFVAQYGCDDDDLLNIGTHIYHLEKVTVTHGWFSFVHDESHDYLELTNTSSTNTIVPNIPEVTIPEVTIALHEFNVFTFDTVQGQDAEGNTLYFKAVLASLPDAVGDYTEENLDYSVLAYSDPACRYNVDSHYQGYHAKLSVHIRKPIVSFRANRNSVTYNGKEQSFNWVVTGITDAYSKDSFGFTVNLKQVRAGSYYEVSKNDVTLTSNHTGITYQADEFDIHYDDSSPYLVIKKKDLRLTVQPKSFYYTGSDQSSQLISCVLKNGLENGDMVSFGTTLYRYTEDGGRETVSSIIDIGTYGMDFTNILVRNNKGEDVTDCYNIIINNEGKFVVYQF